MAEAYSSFYQNCPVLKAEDEAVRRSRLYLCDLVHRVLADGLGLLGIDAPQPHVSNHFGVNRKPMAQEQEEPQPVEEQEEGRLQTRPLLRGQNRRHRGGAIDLVSPVLAPDGVVRTRAGDADRRPRCLALVLENFDRDRPARLRRRQRLRDGPPPARGARSPSPMALVQSVGLAYFMGWLAFIHRVEKGRLPGRACE